MYNRTYDSDFIRNTNYSIENYISKYYKKHYKCLDLGCGSCRKIEKLLKYSKIFYAVDMDKKRIQEAKNRCESYSNIILGVSDNFYLPFNNDSFDLISCFMTKYSVEEIYRILKPNGILIIETLGADDKRVLKKEFGKDNLGWRGRMLSDTHNSKINRLEKILQPHFEILESKSIKFATKISSSKLIELFEMTNEIREFDRKKRFSNNQQNNRF